MRRRSRPPAELVERARAGDGPAFLVAHTYRYHGHHVGDIDRAYYRTKDEEELWRSERDPLALLGALARGAERLRRGGDRSASRTRRAPQIDEGRRVRARRTVSPTRAEVTEDVYA